MAFLGPNGVCYLVTGIEFTNQISVAGFLPNWNFVKRPGLRGPLVCSCASYWFPDPPVCVSGKVGYE